MEVDTSLRFTFTTTIHFDPNVSDGYMKHYVPIPSDVGLHLQEASITHVKGTLNMQPFRRAVQKHPDGEWRLMFGKIWLDQAKLEIGEEVIVAITRDPDPSQVDVPEVLASELERDPALLHAWERLSPSTRKTLGYHVERAKRPETRAKRVQDVLDDLRKTK
ncbi:MAG: YdeI/OmpD-associated family protein [Chloroflexota bacterium]|nr:YdeI/OmpD-associated family protein [Chloroflexota bacterium]